MKLTDFKLDDIVGYEIYNHKTDAKDIIFGRIFAIYDHGAHYKKYAIGWDEQDDKVVYPGVSDESSIRYVNAPNAEIKFSSINKNHKYAIWTGQTKLISNIENRKMENKMAQETETTKPSTLDMVKADGEKAVYRVGARRLSNAARNGVVSLLKSKKMKKAHINAIIEVLDTEIGQAGVSFGLGMLLVKFPGIGSDPRMQRLCEEFRIEGMALAGESLLDTVFKQLTPTFVNVLNNLPKEDNKVRVETLPQSNETTLPYSIDEIEVGVRPNAASHK